MSRSREEMSEEKLDENSKLGPEIQEWILPKLSTGGGGESDKEEKKKRKRKDVFFHGCQGKIVLVY